MNKITPSGPAGRFRLDARQAQLLVIDVQDKLVPAMDQGELTVQKILIMVQIAKAMEMPVLLTEQYPEGLGPTDARLLAQIQAKPVHKLEFSAYTTELKEQLAATTRRQIIVCGLETHVCVFQTVRDLLESGYQVFVVQDAVCSRASPNKQNGLALMTQMGAVVSNLETILFDLLKQAGTPLFKQLSRLIR
jgi:nicotinamidase-related amidase